MKRVAIFAHYDKDCLIDDYVLLYLKNLKECVDDIFFISDCDVKESELRKISDIVTYSECKKHGISKDFGSYKIGFEVLLKKYRNLYDSAQELLFVNDSCYCIGKFDKIFEDTSKIDCDAWSLCDDYCNQKLSYQRYHLQSYFLTLREGVFKEEFFHKFIRSIEKKETSSEVIILYEEGISILMQEKNKKLFSYFSKKSINEKLCSEYTVLVPKIAELISSTIDTKNRTVISNIIGDTFDISTHNQAHSNKYLILILNGFPLLKRAILDKNRSEFSDQKLINFWMEVTDRYTNFDKNILIKHLERTEVNYKRSLDPLPIFKESNFKRFKRKVFYYKVTKKGFFIIKIFGITIFKKKIQ